MFYLVRHGQTDWNLAHKIQGYLDIPLNATGRKEAEICRELLTSVPLDQIISSDLSRAMQTAAIINESLSLPITYDSRLRELNMGDLQGLVKDDISDESWDLLNHNPHKIHAESLEEYYLRAKSFFNDIDHTKNTLIVTHGGFIRITKFLADHPQTFDQDEFERTYLAFKIKNTAVFEWNGADLFQPLE